MKLAVAIAVTVFLAATAQAQGQSQSQPQTSPVPQTLPAQEQRGGSSSALQQRLAPGLAHYTDEVLYGDVWRRTELSARDRSLVTVSVLIATGKTAQLVGHLSRALNNGVQPGEASGVLAHLAFYCGWPSAVSALDVYEQVYGARKVDTAALREMRAPLPPPAEDAPRARAVNEQFGAVSPKFAQITNDVVFGDLWRRPDLNTRDRSLVTIAALAAMGDDDQLDDYVRRGAESGLTRDDISEALIHLGFYAGWSKATSAMQAVTRTLGDTQPRATQEAAPSSNFTGTVSIAEPFGGTGGTRLGGSKVTFQPGARTRWHVHPFGQLLVVTAGRGWVQMEGEPVRAISVGDFVWTPPGARHWHGATRSSAMTHVTASERVEGSEVTWLETVSEGQYRGPE